MRVLNSAACASPCGSVRLMDPVLIGPLFVATAMSAIVVSSVSPDSLLTAADTACILSGMDSFGKLHMRMSL